MNDRISKILNDVQDQNSVAWRALCDYIDQIAASGSDEFVPSEALGDDLFFQIYTLPESISRLKKVKSVGLYGSKLKRLPPEIGQMDSLEYLDLYTSYDLHWLPYEITKCKNLKDSRISTRALYGNFKTRKNFPRLEHNPVRYNSKVLRCSVCKKEMTYRETNQLWITLRIGTDTVPLLANLCSKECEEKLPTPPENYIQYPHKGGLDLVQPLSEEELWKTEIAEYERERLITGKKISVPNSEINFSDLKPLKLIKKIWKK
ncbi:MAG: leucine-rich repeat domain-containing protein [Bacteroidota bacterium]